ncbi:MAG: hypothetical protein K2N25_03415 [Muribaculaceae bacterium]|nr:hypothetical protein [Muribaculaceae bacterium]
MDLGNLFNSLDEDYKDIILAGAIGFPIAYLDCWRLYTPFRDYDLFPQIALSLGVDFIFIGFGIAFCGWIWQVTKHHPMRPSTPAVNIVMLLLTFVLTSAMVLSGTIRTKEAFELFYLGFSILYILFQYILDKISYRRQIKQSQNNDEDDRNLNN